MKATFALFVFFSLIGCKSNVSTPEGTEVLRWTASNSDRRSVVGAKELGPRVKKDAKLIVQPEVQKGFTLKIQLETAPLEIVEDNKAHRNTVPVSVTMSVHDNPDWTVAGKCPSGPHYYMPNAKGETPEAMVLDCIVDMHYKSTTKDWQQLLSIRFTGDGKIEGDLGSGQVRLE